MRFASLVFLFIFMPVTPALYRIEPAGRRNALLLAALPFCGLLLPGESRKRRRIAHLRSCTRSASAPARETAW